MTDFNKENANPNTLAAGIGLKRKREDDPFVKVTKPTLSSQSRVAATLKAATAPSAAAKKPTTGLAKSSTIARTTTVTKPTVGATARATATKPSLAATATERRTTMASGAARPGWDVKGRLQDVEGAYIEMSEQLKRNNSIVEALQRKLNESEQTVQVVSVQKQSLEGNLSQFHKEVEQSNERNRELLRVIDTMDGQHKMEIENWRMKTNLLQSKLDTTEINLRSAQSEAAGLRSQLALVEEKNAELSRQCEDLKNKLERSEKLSEERRLKINDLESKIAEQKENINYLEEKSRADEELRKKLHNAIQELKGNIRVFCRVRPFLGEEKADELVKYVFPRLDDRQMEIVSFMNKEVTGCKTAPEKKHNFKFDKIFPPTSTQSAVFEEISQLVQSALDGYNACIFAYGQTGSGKTFTMEGPGISSSQSESRGMIARAVEQIFNTSYKLKEKGWEYDMFVSFMEIYNETLRDLLEKPKKENVADPKKEEKKYEIKHDANNGETSVTNLTTIKVDDPDRVHDLLKTANKNRAVGKTNMNARSSRSHSVFQMRLVGRNTITGEKVNGLLNLIDLAGSERLDSSGATGDRLIETKNINKSLACLGDVIAALANGDSHIPYRNSKLTYLLQNSLGGNSKTLMFVNISPTSASLNETLSSLRFATKVNACEIGTARRAQKVEFKD